ncbi:hypothetical protein EBQ93_00110 [bacterium]|nr:hypothetical protein [bacterium]
MKKLLLFLNVLACASSFFGADGSPDRSGDAGGGGVEHSVVATQDTKSFQNRILLNVYKERGWVAIQEKITSREWDMDKTVIEDCSNSASPLRYALRLLAAEKGDEKVLELAPVQEAEPRYPVPEMVTEFLCFQSYSAPDGVDFTTEEFAGLYNTWMTRKEVKEAVTHGKWQYLKNHFTPEQLHNLPEYWDGAEVLGRKYKIKDPDVHLRMSATFYGENLVDRLRCYCLIAFLFPEMREYVDLTDEELLIHKKIIENCIITECAFSK